MKELIKTRFVIVFLLVLQSMFGSNNTLASVEKVSRQIPENYKENYTDKEYIYEKNDPSWLVEFKIWLVQKLMSFFKYINYNQGFHHLKILFYVLIATVAIYVIAKILFYKEGTWIFKKKHTDSSITYQDDVETIEISNFELMVEKALQKDDYRLAVKFFYLWSLQKLAKKEVIELSNLKTNIDYQLELEETSFYKQFQNISYYYTYVWYGEFDIDKDSFDKIAVKYEQFLKEIAL